MDFFDFDDAYVRRLREGDRETVDHFYGYFSELLYRVAYRKLHVREQADDVVQTTFLRAWSGLGELREAAKLGAFMQGICNRVILEFNRGNKPTESIDDHNPVDIRPGQHELLLIAQLQALARAMLEEFEQESPNEARLLRELFLDEDDRDELCRRYNVTGANLRLLLHRAIKKFRGLMKRLDPN